MSTKIVAKVSGDKFESAKNLLRALKESSDTIDISTIRYGNLGEDRLLSFNLNEESLKIVIENLIANGIIILFPEQFAKKKETRVSVNNQSASQNVEKSDVIKIITIQV